MSLKQLRVIVCTKDVYGEIAATVREAVAADAAAGVPQAIALRDQIDRKLVKQTVMTSVYGVTFIGARLQIQNRLIERGWANNDALYKCSNYAAKVASAHVHASGSNAQSVGKLDPPSARAWLSCGNNHTCAISLVAMMTQPLTWSVLLLGMQGCCALCGRCASNTAACMHAWMGASVPVPMAEMSALGAVWQMVLKGLDQNFDKATGIMRWLGQCAKVVTGNGHAVSWHTPLGLPVIQPYRERVRAHVIRSSIQVSVYWSRMGK